MNRSHLIKEMNELKRIGVRVPKKAFTLVEQATVEELEDYDNMSNSECVDMFIEMARCL